jgi:DNA polymerase III epsilon subunit-like protein
MLRWSYESVFKRRPEDDGFAIDKLHVIDVVEHDLMIEPSRVDRPRRGLGHLCKHYGVKPGGHDALNDARAAVEVFLEQVLFNTAGQMAFGLVASPNPEAKAW